MNEENNFSIDINAEMQSLKFEESTLDVTPSEFISPQPEEQIGEQINPFNMEVNASINEVLQPKLMETENVNVQSISLADETAETSFSEKVLPQEMGVEATVAQTIPLQPMEVDTQLIDPILIESSEINSAKSVNAQSSNANISNMEIKMDASDAFKKAESVAKQVDDVQRGMGELADGMKNSWLPSREEDAFEERPTTEPTNLIFEQRKARMMIFPEWS